jgi:hypothetical protein
MTKQKNASVTRRSSIAATALSAVALAGLTRRASAEEHKMSATEKTNAKIVGDFMKMWSDPDCTGEKIAAFVSNNCVLRMEENKPAVAGRANAVGPSSLNGCRPFHSVSTAVQVGRMYRLII